MDDEDWQAQSDLRTLTEAERIRADRDRMARAKSEGQRQATAMATVMKTTGTTRDGDRSTVKRAIMDGMGRK